MRLARVPTLGHCFERARSNRGMTLMELMMAVLVLLVSVVGIVPLFTTGLSQASTLRLKSIATNISQEKMERIRQLDYREIYTDAMKAADSTLGNRTLESIFGTTETVRGSAFTITYTVVDQSYETGNLKKVTVDVGWTAPPRVSAAVLTTLVHQQFLGPRGKKLEVIPTHLDPLGTPFARIRDSSTILRYYIAQADWGLIYHDLTQASPVPRDVYVRLGLYDKNGAVVPIGPSANDYKIDSSHLHYSNVSGEVWFEYNLDATTLPDGYWEMQATAYNEFNEPGNTWRLRTRVENGPPETPTDFTASPQADNQTVVLNWLSGPERDRSHWVLERRKRDTSTGDWLPWETVAPSLDPNLSSFTDIGDIAVPADPWGSTGTPNLYEYSLWAVDICIPSKAGVAVQAQAEIPSPTTTTTLTSTTSSTSTTSTSSTTSTTSIVTATVQNTSSSSYVLTVTGGPSVITVTAKKNKSTTISGLIAGRWYQISFVRNAQIVYSSFQAGATPNPVLGIN